MKIIVGILIGIYFNYYIPYVCLILLAIGVLFHYLFCVKTAFNKFLGLA
jgi:TM2 domain-containing membrane protein YozV